MKCFKQVLFYTALNLLFVFNCFADGNGPHYVDPVESNNYQQEKTRDSIARSTASLVYEQQQTRYVVVGSTIFIVFSTWAAVLVMRKKLATN
jgi:hypothetical protein